MIKPSNDVSFSAASSVDSGEPDVVCTHDFCSFIDLFIRDKFINVSVKPPDLLKAFPLRSDLQLVCGMQSFSLRSVRRDAARQHDAAGCSVVPRSLNASAGER